MKYALSGRKQLALAVLAGTLTLTGCPLDDDDNTTATTTGGSTGACTGGVAGFFTRNGSTVPFVMPATFGGTATPTNTTLFTNGNNYDVHADPATQTITFSTDNPATDLVFNYNATTNVLTLCESYAHEEYLRIDTTEYVVLFSVEEGADGQLGTTDDELSFVLSVLNAAGYQDDDRWVFEY